ncbi:MAG: hypothetical protein QOC55_1125 [Thermoleophilaceae bacterium]|jgi:hypothetical protein|nr:hypothetical protein [Thermoleophilaceae bacterium]
MKATKAYIASLGTTGVLLAASILMLAVVSAVVAFNHWPNGNVSTRVQTLVLREKAAPIRVSSHSGAPSATPLTRAVAALGAVPRAGGPSAVAVPRFNGRAGTPAAGTPSAPSAPALPAAPSLPSTSPLIDPISNPGTAAAQVADGVQSVTDSSGVSVGKVNEQLGQVVTQAGQTAADTVRALPLPGHIVPGH